MIIIIIYYVKGNGKGLYFVSILILFNYMYYYLL